MNEPSDMIVQVQQAAPTSLLAAIANASANPAADMDKMERLFAMHQEMVRQAAEVAFNAALARAQAAMLPVATNEANEHTRSRYADLAEINRQIVPLYTGEGLSLSFNTGESPLQNHIRVLGTLSHANGHSRQYHIDLPPDDVGAKGNVNKTGVQATGSTNTYGRRYLAMMIFNLATFDDVDGNGNRPAKATEGASARSVAQNAWDELSAAQQKEVQNIVDCVMAEHDSKGPAASLDLWYSETADLEGEMSAAALTRFPGPMKTAWNKVVKERKEQAAFTKGAQ